VTPTDQPYPAIRDYALISDCRCMALVSRAGSVDWCCMPRLDSDSVFGRLLDWRNGGCWSIRPAQDGYRTHRSYLPDTLVLQTEFTCTQGKARVLDFFAVSDKNPELGQGLHVRLVEGLAGQVELDFLLAPRFDYGAIKPFVHKHSRHFCLAWGSDEGLIIYSDSDLRPNGTSDLRATIAVTAGQRLRFSVRHVPPALLDNENLRPVESAEFLDHQFDATLAWWRRWTGRCNAPYRDDPQTLRSILVLKALTYERSGAIAAAATTSLPEWIGGERNWDYRYSWVRDSVFTVRALHELGYRQEADRFAAFIERSAAGSADQLQIVFGVDGKRRLTEIELGWLEGYRGSRPVRVGNLAAEQSQLDAYGELLELAWLRHCHGSGLTERHWRFLADVVNVAARRWHERDYGIWEVRNGPRHFVFSKAMCWCALQRGIQLANLYRLAVPLKAWQQARDDIQQAIFAHGYDSKRGVFRQAFGDDYLDSALLLLPWFGFISYDDPRMMRTTDAICAGLDHKGLLLRYNSPDGLSCKEGAFLPCTFWLVDCLANQGQLDRARRYYDTAMQCANDLGLFAEEFDRESNVMLGNLPQGLTHVSQIVAKLALTKQIHSANRHSQLS
jgi:GH15 family glucan-1,4-alpha-glucosidase